MPNPRLAGRYAKSLLDLAIEKGELEKVYADMLWLQSICKTNRDFVVLLKSPVINADKKEKILEAITKGRVSEMTAAFNRLLISKNRESFLPEILTAFVNQYKAHKDIHTVKLITAVPVSEELKQHIIDHIRESSNMKIIELETSVDEKLIGGFVLQAGDKLVDGSIAYNLKTIGRQFENNDFVFKVR